MPATRSPSCRLVAVGRMPPTNIMEVIESGYVTSGIVLGVVAMVAMTGWWCTTYEVRVVAKRQIVVLDVGGGWMKIKRKTFTVRHVCIPNSTASGGTQPLLSSPINHINSSPKLIANLFLNPLSSFLIQNRRRISCLVW
ncbi:hypothetical protein L2E82_06315 [Cichorium intybus]|uniref:Uncharacterized protein n=1 Tax=Cichorium intybus TaxID=13427 RepID=A0ACB9H9L4_CICIN|nr:hypothetical protein L2E82_06315 [Cichorium intybus]